MERGQKEKIEPKKRIAIARTKLILGIPSSRKSKRGLGAEERALSILRDLRKKKIEFPGQRLIKKFTPVLHFSLEDQEGKDIILEFEVKSQAIEILPFQIQNWWSKESEEEFSKKGICLVVIPPKEDKEKAKERVFQQIVSFLQ